MISIKLFSSTFSSSESVVKLMLSGGKSLKAKDALHDAQSNFLPKEKVIYPATNNKALSLHCR
uniref:Uncharacterized protein n=1 Tax=Lepeophtheirus salmonis TaxID=72036 RepID=A0A0K2TDI4_LEPSM